MHKQLAAIALAAVVALATTAAAEPRAGLQIEGRQAYAGMPFVLQLVVEGMDEAPAPAQPSLAIAGATVTPMGAQPQVSRSVQIINGRRTDSTEVTWVFEYRVLAEKPGTFTVPALTVTQGSQKATTDSASVTLGALASTDDMKIIVVLPERPVWVGESIPIELDWLVRRNVSDQTFSIPILGMDDTFAIAAAPPADKRQALTVAAGNRDLSLGFTRDEAMIDGQNYTRFKFPLTVTPKKAGSITIPPASVVASLAVGRQDFFGNGKLFRSTDIERTLEVKALPQTDRPGAFAGAVGSAFSIGVTASRSVVSLGEPVDLDITIRGDQGLDVLSLGRLDGDGGLPKDKFAVPTEPPVGALADDGKSKTFRVPVQVIGAATEIPALTFAYFDPVKAAYQTIHSEPIALSVKGGSMIGANDVVGGPAKPTTTARAPGPSPAELSLVGADLALSSPGAALDRPVSGGLLWVLMGLLYLVPLSLLGFRTWQRRTAKERGDASEVRAARRRLDEELARAASAPARDTAGSLVSALRSLARALAAEGATETTDRGLYQRLETEGFAPSAASSPLASGLRDEVRALAAAWMTRERARTRKPGSAAGDAAAMLLLVVLGTGALASVAQAGPVEEGRGAYADAMATSDGPRRRSDFAAAAASFGRAVVENPGRPDLLTDWGNAALGAGDIATATLAFRRAVAIDGSNARALRNLAWLRGRQPEGFRATSGGATDALLFFAAWPRSRRMLVGAFAFAAFALMLVPWGTRRHRGLRALALLPAAVWIAMVASVLFEDRHDDDAIVIDSVVLRAADSAGAPAALSQPLPRGAEVAIVERRDSWLRIRLASGATGWVSAGSVERVQP